MRDLHVGRGVTWPAKLASQAIGVLGMRGAGKSNLGRVYAEELFASSIPFVVFDPIGNWYGIRAGRDGKPGGGIPIPIFGGQHGDLPLDRGSGQRIADLVLDRRLSCVLDLSHADFSEADKRRFLIDFGERLFRKKSRESGWLTLIMEEADDYAPQTTRGGGQGSTAETLGMFQRLVKRGRFKGLGSLLITQRSAAINKDLLYMVGTLLVFRTTGPRDQDAVGGWVKYNAVGEKLLESLPTLEDGQAWVIAPEALGSIERVRFRQMATFDTGATPEHGGSGAKPATLADIDVPALSKELEAAREKAKAQDPRELQKKIVDLERQLATAARSKPAAPAPKLKEVSVLKDAHVKQLEAAAARIDRAMVQLGKWAQAFTGTEREVRNVAAEISAALAAPRSQPSPTTTGGHHALRDKGRPGVIGAPAPAVSRAPAAPRSNSTGAVGLGNTGARRMLIALAQHPGGLTDTKLSILTGITKSGGTWRTYMGQLRGDGLVSGDRSRFFITERGRVSLGDYDPLPSGEELIGYWRSRLGDSGKRRIFDVLVEAYPAALDQAVVAQRSGVELGGGTWRTYAGELRGLELITGRGELRASEDLFS